MSKGQRLRALVSERLTAAAEEIFALVERTIAEYEEELCRSKEENQRKQQLLDQVLNPQDPAPNTGTVSPTTTQPPQPSNVQIQTESLSQAPLLKQEEERGPDVTCVIVKSEGDDEEDREDAAEAPPTSPRPIQTAASIEVYILDPDPDMPLPESSTPETSSTGVTDGEQREQQPPIGKRKRGRPRRVMLPSDAAVKRPSDRSSEARVETRSRGGAGPDAIAATPSTALSTSLPSPQTETPLDAEALSSKDSEKTPAQNFQIKAETRDAAGPSLENVDLLRSDIEASEREEHLSEFTAAFESSSEQSERRQDTDCEDWSYEWQPQAGSSQQLIDSDDEPDDYNPNADSEDPFMDFTGKVSVSKSGTAGSDTDGKIKHECPICRKKLGRKQELKRHMLLHTGEKPFSCPVCDKRFIQKSNLKSHFVIHLDSMDTIIRFKKPLEANRGDTEEWGGAEGELGLDSPDKLTEHLSDSEHEEDWAAMMEPATSGSSRRMEAEPTYEEQDASSLERISLLLSQALNESKARGKATEFQCPMCDKIFGRMENLRRHLLVHTGEKAFGCPVCNKQFTLKQHLKLHMVLHTRDQQFSCSICSKTFIRKDNLRSHMRIHSTDRPFGCSQCGARFYTDQDLARHMAHHTGERPFVCPICNSAFLSRRYLNRHIKIHQREEGKAQVTALD